MSIEKIRELRERTSVSLTDCRKALQSAHGDVEKAIIELKKAGKLRAAKMRSKEAKEGRLYTYLHHDGKQGCMVEVNCQTDFSANTDQFESFCESVALQIISMEPQWLTSADVPDDVVRVQREIFQTQLDKVPEDKKEHVVNQKLKKWFSEVCLMDQKSVTVSGKTIEALREELVQQIQENVVVKRYVHWKLGQ
jgi:elongation factor Ts